MLSTQVQLVNTAQYRNIFKLKLWHMLIKVESQKAISKCHRYQKYGHHQDKCHHSARCVEFGQQQISIYTGSHGTPQRSAQIMQAHTPPTAGNVDALHKPTIRLYQLSKLDHSISLMQQPNLQRRNTRPGGKERATLK